MTRHGKQRVSIVTAVKVPPAGDDAVEPEILAVYVSSGQRVSAGQPLAEIGFDKVDVEVVAPHDGLVAAVFVSVGDVVALDADLFALEP